MIDVQHCDLHVVSEEGGAKGVVMQWLLDRRCGAENFAMRRFVIEPGGFTPLHAHPWEHEVYIIRGVGEVTHAGGVSCFAPDTAILVKSEEIHQFRNTGVEPLEFLCLVPDGPATAVLPD
ncbi:MAG: cupin domain-containing protein [Armatimonadota bacterium]